MAQVRIRFIRPGWSSALGGFSEGDIASVGADYARSLVVDAGCAEYLAPKQTDVKPEPPNEPVKQEAKPVAEPLSKKRK